MEKVVENNDIAEEGDAELAASRVYEVGFNILPTIASDDVSREFGNIKALIEKRGGVFISEELPKLRPLAYSISKVIGIKKEKFNEAYFGWVKFEADAQAVIEIKKDLGAYENILRFLILKTVRESTLAQGRATNRRGDGENKADGTEETVAPASAETIDASIEKLVIE